MPSAQPKHDLHRQFDLNMPSAALHALGVIVAYNHLHSQEKAIRQYGEVGKSRCGTIRWISTDADVLQIIQSSFAEVNAELVDNPTNGGTHIVIVCGEFKLLLIHDVDPDAQVPFSDYGRTEASNNRYSLFVSEENWVAAHPTAASTQYTSVLFHSKTSSHELPNTLEVRFPDGDDGYQAPAINLYKRFPELQDETSVNRLYTEISAPVATEVIEDEAHPKPRKIKQISV